MTERQKAVSLALDAYKDATLNANVERAIYWRSKVLELVEMKDIATAFGPIPAGMR